MPGADREMPTETALVNADQAIGDDVVAAELLQGLSWSWELDFETLLAALNDPAPWNRPARSAGSASQTDTATVIDAASAPGSGAVDAAAAGASAVDPSNDGAVDAADGDGAADGGDTDSADAELAELMEAIEAGRTRQVPLSVAAGRVAESLPPGPDLTGWLATSPVGDLEDGALAGVAAAYRRLASWAQAGELAAVAQIASRSAAADDKIGVGAEGRPTRMPDEACAQISLALTMSQCGASWWTDLAITLNWKLAATGAALRAGEIDLSRARLIAEATGPLDEDTARVVEARVLPAAGHQTTAQLRAALRRAVIAADPEGADRRREEAERRAKVSLYPDHEGTASLAGYSLPGTRAAAAMARISALARAMKASGAGGGIDLLRAHVFLGLLLGTLPYIPPAPESPPDQPGPDGSLARPGPGGSDRPGSDVPGSGGLPDQQGPDGPAAGPDRDPDDPGPSQPDPDCGDECHLDDDPCSPAANLLDSDDEDDGWADPRPAPAWPEVTAFLPPAPPAMGDLRPGSGGLLDLTLPWATLAGESAEPGHLSRIGPITPTQACHLADLAASDTTVQWRIILTNPVGQARAVARLPRASVRAGPAAPSADPDVSAGLVGRVTLTISEEAFSRPPPPAAPVILARTLRAAAQAASRAAEQAAADAFADSGCAHTEASPAYRPPPRLKEKVTARDVTCRFPTCRQPVWRCDLDHTIPFGQDGQGGRTCACNLGGLCRTHHQLKQHPDWNLTQPSPGHFQWTTPTGRAYATGPDSYPV